MLIENITHACLKFYFKNKILLTDPWIVEDPIKAGMIYKLPRMRSKPLDVVKNVDYCYISHTHEDHFHVPSLKLFSKKTKFFIPDFSHHKKGRRGEVMFQTLKKMGFNKIKKVKPWQKIKVDTDTYIQLIPSAKSRYFDWENSGLAVIDKKGSYLNMNDNMVDTELCKEIKKKIQNIYIYFIQTAGISTYPACFDFSESQKKTIIKKKAEDYSLHKLVKRIIKPKYLIPYAGDFGWFGKYLKFNFWSRSTPIKLINFLKRNKVKTFEFLPGDRIMISDKKLSHENSFPVNWDNFDRLINEHSKYYKKIIKRTEKKYEKNKVTNLKENATKYVSSLNVVNSRSNFYPTFSASSAYCIYNIINNKKKIYFYILVKALKNKPLKLQICDDIPKNISQLHYLKSNAFFSILQGNAMLNKVQWRSSIKQIKKFNNKIRDLMFFNGYHIDGDNRTPQIKLRKIYQIRESQNL